MKKLLYLSDLYNFYVSQNKNVKFSSKDEDTTIVIHIDEPFTYSETKDDELNLYCPIRLCHTEKNINQSFISEKAMKNALSTAYNMPILGYIYNNGEKDVFASHEFFVNDDGEIIYEEVPVGTIPESADLKLVYDEDMDKTYVDGTGIIWKTYSKAAEIIEREKQLSVSVELFVDELSYDSKNKVLCIDKFRFSGVTILQEDRGTGEEVKPGMVGSNISIADFSVENNSIFSQNEKVIEMLSALSEKIDNLNIEKISKEGGNPVKKEFEEITEEVSEEVTEEEVKNSPSEEVFDDNDGDGADPDSEDVDYYDDPSDAEEGNDGEEENNSGDGDNSDDGDDSGDDDEDDDEGDDDIIISDDDEDGKKKKRTDEYSVTISRGEETKTFAVSLQDKIEALYTLVNDTYAEADGCYYDCTVYDEDKYVIMSSWWTGDAYKQSYKVKKDVYSLVGDRVRVKAVYVTEDEEKALENMRANYSAIEEKLAKYESEPAKKEILQSEDWKNIRETEEFAELSKRENYFDLSTDELTNKLDKMLLEYSKHNKIEFSSEEPEKKQVGMKLFGNPSKKAGKSSSRYGGIFSK